MLRRALVPPITLATAVLAMLATPSAYAQDAGMPRQPFSAIVSPGEQLDLFFAYPALLVLVVALVVVTIALGIYTIRRALAEAREERRR